MMTFALVTMAQPTLAHTEFDCVTTKVTIASAPGEDRSARTEEHLGFVIDDAAKTVAFTDGKQLRVKRFDESWISADRDDIQYEFDRSDGALTYAGSIVRDSTVTTIVGSGRCKLYRSPLR